MSIGIEEEALLLASDDFATWRSDGVLYKDPLITSFWECTLCNPNIIVLNSIH
jgi:sucrose-6-phosphate hydrolase SacC (GH32 family)